MPRLTIVFIVSLLVAPLAQADDYCHQQCESEHQQCLEELRDEHGQPDDADEEDRDWARPSTADCDLTLEHCQERCLEDE